MTPSHDLFKLIKSLTPTEKAYFRKFSLFTKYKVRENVYLRLFEAIDKQNEYNEEKLKKKFKNETFMKQLPVVKNYLYSRILDALELYHGEMNQRVSIRNTLNKAEILRKKGLYDQSLKVIKKAKVFAKENEMHLPLLDIYIHIELGLAIEKYDLNWVQNVNKEINNNLALFKNDAIMHDLNFKIAIYYHKYLSTRNPVFLRQAKEIINNKHLSDISEAKTFFGRNRFYESHAFYALAKGDSKAVYFNAKKIISNFESTAGMIERNFVSYAGALNNYINICAELRKNEEGLIALGKLMEHPSFLNSLSIRSKVFGIYNYLFLFLNNNVGNFDESKKRIAGIMTELKLFEEEMNDMEKAVLYVNMAITFFGLGDLKTCVRWLNQARNDLDMQHQPEMDCFIRIFYLVAQYESHNTDLIPYLVRSDARFFSKKQNAYELETVFLDFLKNKITKAKTDAQRIEFFRELKKKFTPLVNHPQERAYFKYFDFIKWIDGVIEGQPYGNMIAG